jgi:DNA invertase Pin-like site-specific DNA recombinase
MSEPLRSPKLRPWHLDRLAVVYVRQSTPQQVTDHKESTARQYALADRAAALGWTRDRVVTIDDDLGKSGQSVEGRPGFQRLLAEVALDRVGLILGLEMSRLARSCKDWHQLLELCGRYRVLLADADGCTTRPFGPPPPGSARGYERGRASRAEATDVPGQAEQGPPRRVARHPADRLHPCPDRRVGDRPG